MRISIRKSQRGQELVSQSRERHGFVLVEVIVAMILLAVAVSSLAALVWSVSHSGIRTTGDAYRNGVLMHEVNRLEGVPYDSIPTGYVETTVSGGSYAHTRIVSVSEPAANVIKSIKIVIKPLNKSYRADSVTFLRTKARTSRVLCTDCPQG
jgi:prepilin-type N-terminal cleavage/methylation domain-containing protein